MDYPWLKLQSPAALGKALRKAARHAAERLEPREVAVLRLRFGLEDGRVRSLDEVARSLDLSRNQVRILQDNALTRLLDPGDEPDEVLPLIVFAALYDED